MKRLSPCRRGELLSLQWSQLQRDEQGQAQVVVLPASKTKTHDLRVIPVSSDLRAVLEMRRTDPTGQSLPPDAYVFGNAVGERLTSIKTAWRNTCRRAGIHDLHFHDLRREFACRLLESSANLHDVRDFLGHANITTTSHGTYGVRRCAWRRRWSGWRRQPRPWQTPMTSRTSLRCVDGSHAEDSRPCASLRMVPAAPHRLAPTTVRNSPSTDTGTA